MSKKWQKNLGAVEYFGGKRVEKLAEFETQGMTFQVNLFMTTMNTDGQPYSITILEHVHDAGHTEIGRIVEVTTHVMQGKALIRFESSFFREDEPLGQDYYYALDMGPGLAFIIGRYMFWLDQQAEEVFDAKEGNEFEGGSI